MELVLKIMSYVKIKLSQPDMIFIRIFLKVTTKSSHLIMISALLIFKK